MSVCLVIVIIETVLDNVCLAPVSCVTREINIVITDMGPVPATWDSLWSPLLRTLPNQT